VELAEGTVEVVWISAAFALGLIFSRVGLPPSSDSCSPASA
jgi:hypothetical protein